MKKRVSVILLLMLTLALCLSAAVMAGVQLMEVDETCEHANTDYLDNENGTHNRVCKACGKVLETNNCVYTLVDYYRNDANGHYFMCSWCSAKSDSVKAEHTLLTLPTDDGKYHTTRCKDCSYILDGGENQSHDTFGEDGACSVCGFKEVAKDDAGNLYESLQDAFDMVSSGGTITLTANIQPDELIDFDREDGCSVTLVMGGHTLSGTSMGPALTVSGGSLTIADAATITAKDGSASSNAVYSAIEVTGGALTFENNLTAKGGSGSNSIQPAISVSGGTVTFRGDLTAKGGYYDGNGNPDAQAPAVYAEGGTLDFLGEETTLSFEGGLTITGTAKLKNGLTHGEFRSNAAYAVINTPGQVKRVSVEGSEEYKNLYSLLGTNRAFADKGTDNINTGAMLDSQDFYTGDLTIIEHEHKWTDKGGSHECVCGRSDGHSYDASGKCSACGKSCPHPDRSGVWNAELQENVYTCVKCGTRLFVENTFGIQGTSDFDYAYFTNLKDAMAAAGDGWTVKLLGNIVVDSNVDIYDENDVARTITLNLNGKNITGSRVIWIGKLPLDTGYPKYEDISILSPTTLNIVGSGSILTSANLSIAEKATLNLEGWTGGTINILSSSKSDDGESTLVIGENAGTINSLRFFNWPTDKTSNTTYIENTKLSGGSYGEISITMTSPTGANKLIPYSSMLAEGYAFQYINSGEFVDYAAKADYDSGGGKLEKVRVVKCTAHVDKTGAVDSEENAIGDGLCDYCNTKLSENAVATLTVGDATYFYTDLAAAFDKANTTGGTITMQKNVTGLEKKDLVLGGASNWNDYDITLDLNGKKISGTGGDGSNEFLVVDTYGTVTICDSSTEKTGGIESTGRGECAMYVSTGTLIVEAGTFASTDSDGNALGANSATLEITGGTFNRPVVVHNGNVSISGGSFAAIWNFNYSGSVPVRDLLAEGKAFADNDSNEIKDATATSLTNVHVVDCPHPRVDDSSKCTACGMQMTAKVVSGETTTYFANGINSDGNTQCGLYFAFEAAKTGDTVTALVSSTADQPVTAWPDGGMELTLDLNGQSLTTITVGDSVVGNKLTIYGKGKVDSLLVREGNTAVLTVRDYGIGTTFGKINANGTKTGVLLDTGCAFRVGDDEYVAYNAATIPENVTVVQCSHIDIDVVEDATGAHIGACPYCGESGFAARLETVEGVSTYNTIDKAVEAWLLKSGTLTLYTDYAASGNFPSGRMLTLDLNGCRFNVDKDGNFTGLMNLDGAMLTITDSSGKNGVFGSLTAGSGHLTLLSGRIKGLTVSAENVVSLQGGSVEGVECTYPIYKLIPNGYALMNANFAVNPTEKPNSSVTYTIKNSQNTVVSDGKTGSVDYGEKKIPLALSLVAADTDVKLIEFQWYRVKDDGTPVLLASSKDDIAPAENDVYTFDAKNVTIDAKGWEGLDASDTPYEVICVVIGKTSGGAYKWRTAYGNYQLTVEPMDLNKLKDSLEFKYVSGHNVGDKFVYTPWGGYPESATELTYGFEVWLNGQKYIDLGTDYEIVGDSNKAKNAGTHTVTIRGIGNYTGELSAQWTIERYTLPADADKVWTDNISKDYDGTTSFDLSNFQFGLNLYASEDVSKRGTVNPTLGGDETAISIHLSDSDYTITPIIFDSAEAGDRTVTFAVTLKDSGNFVFEGGSKTLSVKKSRYVSILQADAPDDVTASVTVANNYQNAYYIPLPALPTLPAGCEYGTVDYQADSLDLTGGYANSTATITSDNQLQLCVPQVESSDEGSVGTVKVKVSTNNYRDFYIIFNVSATNKTIPELKEVSATAITYGDTLGKSTVSGTMINPDTKEPLRGTFSWVDGSLKPDAGNYTATWKFTPDNGSTYAETTGTVVVKVNRKSIDNTLYVNFSELIYNGNPQTPKVNSVTFQLDPNDPEDIVALTAGKDYSVTVEPQTNVGQYKLTINGEGNYAGSVEKTWMISQKVVLNPTITVADGVYNNGEGVTPEVTVKDGDTVIPASEYDVIYSNNKNAGTGKVEVKSKDGSNYQLGDAGAVLEQTFIINKANQTIGVDTINATYGDTGVKAFDGTLYGATYTVTAGGDVVTVDDEGNLTFLKAGDAKIKITAAGDDNHNPAEKEITVKAAKKGLTVRALDRTAYVGGTAPDLTNPVRGTDYEIEGLVNGDDFVIKPTMYYAVEPDMTKPGTYVIVFAGFLTSSDVYLNNYDGVCANGTLTISYAPPTTYSITVAESENGSVTASRRSASSGQTVTLTVTPDEGYALSSLTVTDAKGNAVAVTETGGAYSFRMPASKVTVTAAFAKINTEPRFDDVTENDWFYDDVEWAAEQGLVSGVSDTRFDPNSGCSRAHVVTMLWRAAGCPVVNYLMPFTDVAEDVWYTEAVRWAASERIVLGTSDTTFTPDRICTRAQIAAMLWRYAQWAEMDTTQGGMAIREFEDYADIPEYALEPMGWAVNAGILVGSDNRLTPNADCTRAQIAAILHRALGK